MKNSFLLIGSVALLAAVAQVGSTTVFADAAENTQVHSIDSVSRIRLPHGDSPAPWIAAHRGQWRDFPENSIPGFLAAIRDGADILETDIRQTKDGHLVLMHDPSVDRTTNGTGNVADMTLDEIKGLRLRQSLGNGPSPITAYQVPTLGELLDAVEGENVLINLDKGWDYREQMYQLLSERDMIAYGLFKGSPNVPDAVEFMQMHPDAYYMHVINDAEVGHFDEFGDTMPDMIEIAWDSPDDVQGTDEFWKKVDARTAIYADSMWNSISGGHTDEASLLDPSTGWGYHMSRGADVIQTDNITAIEAWRNGQDITKYLLKPGSIRVQAEDYVNDPAWYFDTNPENECKVPVTHPENPVDACNLDGAKIIQYIRDGEYWALDFDVPTAGKYQLTMRHSADTEPGGSVTVETEDGQKKVVPLPNTTHNRNFAVASLGKFDLKQGINRVKFTFAHPDYLSVDWVQADPVVAPANAPVPSTATVTAPAPAPVTTTVTATSTVTAPAQPAATSTATTAGSVPSVSASKLGSSSSSSTPDGSSAGKSIAVVLGILATTAAAVGAAFYFHLIPEFDQFLPEF